MVLSRRSLHFTIFGALEMFVKCKIVKIKDDFYTKTLKWEIFFPKVYFLGYFTIKTVM